MKKVILLLCGLMLLANNNKLFAQDNRQEVYDKINIPNKKPIPYPPVREADVMWAKIIWRIIDLREKVNLPLYYPTQPIDNRYNLVSLLLKGIDTEGLTAYDAQDERNEFKVKLTKDAIDVVMGKEQKTIKVQDSSGNVTEKNVEGQREIEQVKQIMVKEKWFFDKNNSTMEVRILGLCPLRIYNHLDDSGNPPTDEIRKKKTFWIYYPDYRDLLSRHEVFNRNNDAQQISYDDYFVQRRFNSYIFQESNAYDNRSITSYATGVDAMYESEKIKKYLFETEHDLWEY